MFPSPSIEPPELEDFQWHFNGLTFGAGTEFGVLKAEGLDLAEIRSGDVNLPRDHGQLKGLDVYGGKDIIFDLWVKTDGKSLQEALRELAAATVVKPNEDEPLWFQLPDSPILCVMCRPRKRPSPIDSDYAAADISKPELVLHATDPRCYGAGKESVLKMSPPGGSTATLANTGNTEMRPVTVFTGPIAAPKIENTSITGSPYLELVDPAPKEKREAEELVEREKWTKEHFTEGKITLKELNEKEEKQKEERPAKLEEETDKEEKGEQPTVKAGDQLLVDLGTPHLIQYYKGGIGVGEPENAAGWLQPGSVWWDILTGNNVVKFLSLDEADTGGTAAIEWAPATEL